MKNILLAAVASTALASGALANAGPVASAPCVPKAVNWAGGKVGVQLGYGHSTNNGSHNYNPVANPANTQFYRLHGDSASDGILGGLHGDWDWQSGNWLYGLGAMFDFSSMDGSHKAIDTLTTPGATWELTQKARMKWTVGVAARAGYVMDSSLFYGSVGWVGSKWEVSSTFRDTSVAAPNAYSVSKSKFTSGIRLALGAAQKMDRWILGVEAGYSFYGKVSQNVRALNNTVNVSSKIEPRVLDAKVKLSYAF